MLFLTDANIFVPMVNGLRQMGHDVFDLKEQRLERLSDPELFQLAQSEKRILVTMDKDFSSILLYPPGEHEGIVAVPFKGPGSHPDIPCHHKGSKTRGHPAESGDH